MNESKNNASTMYHNIPAVAALNHVPGFDPVKLLRRTRSRKIDEDVLKLALPYKKLWFRLANPKGRIKLNALRVTEQLAIYEALVYLDRSDTEPISNFTASCAKEDAPDGNYIVAAQEEAMDEALSGAGFGLQFADVGMTKKAERYGSEIPLSGIPVNGAAKETANGTVPAAAPAATREVTVETAARTVSHNTQTQIKSAATLAVNREAAIEAELHHTPVQRNTAMTVENRKEIPMSEAVKPQPVVEKKLPAMDVQERLPVPEMQEEALPVPPAVQHHNVSQVQEEETLPVPGPMGMQKTDMEKTIGANTVSVDQKGHEKKEQHVKTEVSEAQKAAQILYMNPAAEKVKKAETGTAAEAVPAEECVPKYTPDMPVEEILKVMTFEEAEKVVVDTGTCNGWTIAEVAARRAPSLKFYLYGGYKGNNNILRAAAKIMLDHLTAQKAG